MNEIDPHILANTVVTKLKDALAYEGDGHALVQRIPFICNDIRDIRLAIAKQETNYTWLRWLIVAIAGGVGILALHALGVSV